jgi:hypothetical protein
VTGPGGPGAHDVRVLARESASHVVGESGLPLIVAEDHQGHSAFNVIRWILEGDHQYRTIMRVARDFRPDVLVTSALCHGALLAAERLDVPVVVVGFAAHMFEYASGGVPEPGTRSAPRDWVSRVVSDGYREHRERAGLPPRRDPECYTPLLGTATLLRGDPSLEIPGARLPERVTHTGPCDWEPTPDPAELADVTSRLDRVGKPLVYVHLGRVFEKTNPWPRLNAVFTDGPFQAVVELGRSKDPRPAPGADLLVVRKPWMGPLLDRASLALTSATSAPVLGALLRGVPLGVSPAGSEQPILAAACLRAGLAVQVSDDVGPETPAALEALWEDQDLRARTAEMGRRLRGSEGARRAADVVEGVSGAAVGTGLLPAMAGY